MAKGQKSSNKEVRKPKQAKTAGATAAPVLLGKGLVDQINKSSNKK